MVTRLYALVMLVPAVLALLAVPGRADAAPAPGTPVPVCSVGAYLSDIYNLDPSSDTFSARFRIWGVCPGTYPDPLTHLSLPTNAGAQLGSVEPARRGATFWTTTTLQGPFRYHWDVDNFPFDRHRLIVLLTAPADVTQLRFTADIADSKANPAIVVPGWKLDGFHVAVVVQHLLSNFGDPNLPSNSGSTFNRLQLTIDLTRESPVAFWKTIGPLLILFLVTLFLFIVVEFDPEACRSRLSALGAALLAVLVNMSLADAQVPSTGLTMLDELHVLTLLWILLCVIMVTLSWHWGSSISSRPFENELLRMAYRQRVVKRLRRLHRRTLWVGTAVYVTASAALVAHATT